VLSNDLVFAVVVFVVVVVKELAVTILHIIGFCSSGIVNDIDDVIEPRGDRGGVVRADVDRSWVELPSQPPSISFSESKLDIDS
tara:strand:- start:53 stop:304 length:252 start_codon:yes stop_codon:yes gene_type:complete